VKRSKRAPQKCITMTEAVTLASVRGISVTRPTIAHWCIIYSLGHQLGGPGGRWVIYENKFKRFLDGDSA
jgi:hypothetical protein